MPRLPSVLSTDDLPLAELCAARIDGDVVTLAGGWAPVDEPDLPRQRALAAATGIGERAVIERISAAWVHGAVPVPPRIPQMCVPLQSRIGKRFHQLVELREVVLHDEDVLTWPGARCTAPLRTIIDILRDATLPDERASHVAAALLSACGQPADVVAERLRRWEHLPGKRRALRRLDACLSNPAE